MQNISKKNIIITVISIIAVMITIVIIVLPRVIKNSALEKLMFELKENIEDTTSQYAEYCKDFILEVEQSNFIVKINMNNDFENLDYEKRKDMIINISTDIDNKLQNYINKRNKVIKVTNKDEIDYKIVLYANENSYTYNDIIKEIKKNDTIYKVRDYVKDEIIKRLSIDTKDEIYSLLNSINDNELNEIFNNIEEYKNKEELLEKIKYNHRLDGKWKGSIYDGSVPNFTVSVTHIWIIEGDSCYNVYNTSSTRNEYKKYYCTNDNDMFYIFENKEKSNNKNNALFKMKYKDEKLSYVFKPGYENNNYLGREYNISLKRISNSVELPSREIIKNPTIGMTKTEVENSTWGKPSKINKTTTAYGIHEQWVYSNGKYLYFDNGKLTSIQE